MIDTSLMVNDYPEPTEPKLKCFKFEFRATLKGVGIIYARDIEQAKNKAENGECDDVLDTWGFEVEEVIEIEES